MLLLFNYKLPVDTPIPMKLYFVVPALEEGREKTLPAQHWAKLKKCAALSYTMADAVTEQGRERLRYHIPKARISFESCNR